MFGITRAPDFNRPGLRWFNVERPLGLADVRGRVTILDFWTFCCINCFHTLPTLRLIEEAFPDEVAVIGVHTPKFAHERDPEALAQAIRRYDVRHPVVHDPEMVLWGEYAVRAWPTLVLISPDGHVIGQVEGEPHPELLMQGIGTMVHRFWSSGKMKSRALPLAPAQAGGGRLRFPGKIKACPSTDGVKRWAVADSGHHQVVLVGDDGSELARWGVGTPGFKDGNGEAQFNGPEGLACDAASIWVADTRNHAIRRIDRVSGEVETVAGMGLRGGVLGDAEPGREVALASPWDLALVEDSLYFANAGSHQIGALALGTGMVRPVAGSGGEAIVDGPAEQAELAQPSGLSYSVADHALYFADSETSSLRKLRLGPVPQVETVVGEGLFSFGHANGVLADASFQHPLGVAAGGGHLIYVADSYNSGIRVVDLVKGTVSDIASPVCGEPAGIAADGENRLLVSDTNNHRILELDLATGISRCWME